MATKSTKTAVATTPQGALDFSQERPDWVKDSNRGSENVGSKDMALPRLEIVQSLSPIRKDKSDMYNPDAQEGMLFNSVTGELLAPPVYIVPIYFRVEWLVWKEQDQGGGFFGAYDNLDDAEARKAQEEANGERYLEIVDTPVQYCLRIKEDGTTEQIVISMAKSKAKVSRKWNSLIQIAGGDRFSRVYRLGTFEDRNKKNQEFYNYVVSPAGYTPKAIFDETERLYEVFQREGVRADHASAASVSNDGEGSSDHERNI